MGINHRHSSYLHCPVNDEGWRRAVKVGQDVAVLEENEENKIRRQRIEEMQKWQWLCTTGKGDFTAVYGRK